jgi:hypothetical protein
VGANPRRRRFLGGSVHDGKGEVVLGRGVEILIMGQR